MIDPAVPRFWIWMGGRKQFGSYLAFIALTAMAFPLHATFVEYSVAMLAALGVTSGLVALEDKMRVPPKDDAGENP